MLGPEQGQENRDRGAVGNGSVAVASDVLDGRQQAEAVVQGGAQRDQGRGAQGQAPRNRKGPSQQNDRARTDVDDLAAPLLLLRPAPAYRQGRQQHSCKPGQDSGHAQELLRDHRTQTIWLKQPAGSWSSGAA